MHEGGHAAHFANVKQASPLFSQERAPTSVAYAENQSMFLDSLVSLLFPHQFCINFSSFKSVVMLLGLVDTHLIQLEK